MPKFYRIILRSLYTLLYIEIKNIGGSLHYFSYCYLLFVTNAFSGFFTIPSYTNPRMRGYDGLCVFPLEVAAYSRHTSV